MAPSSISQNDQDALSLEDVDLFEHIVDLVDDHQRHDFFWAHATLRNESAVRRLCDEVVRLVRVDLQQAERLATTARWLAEDLGDDYCRGRSYRAAANVTYIKGDHKPALVQYEAALQCFENLGDEREAAITRSSALHNLVFIGEYERAFAWARIARKTFEDLGDQLRLARLEGNLGNILFRQDRWEEAAERFRVAYEVLLDVGKPYDVAISLRNMAVCHVSLNNFLQALELYEQARVYCEEKDLPILVGEIDYNIAYLHYLRGEYTLAIDLYNKTRSKCRELGERYHLALCDLDQAELFLELNLVGEAAELAQQAFVGFEELEMNYEAAKALANLAIARSREGKTFLALELLSKARDMFVNEQNQVWPALIGLYEALVLYRAGRLLEATRFAKSALSGFSEIPTKEAMCEILLARLHLDNEEEERARRHCRSAMQRLRSLDVPALKHQLFFVLGQVEEAAKRHGPALEAYREAQGSLERLRSHLQIEELKVALPEDKLAVYECLVDLTLNYDVAAVDMPRVFSYIEHAKARSLSDLMAFRAHALPPMRETRSGQADQVRQLREELNWYYRQIDLQEMRGDDRSLEDVAQLRDVSRRQEEHLVRTLRELQSADQEFSSLQEAATVDLEGIRSSIPDDAQLVEYYFARGTVYVCVLTFDELEIFPVSVVSRVRELHKKLQFQLSKFRLGPEYVEEFSDLIDDATYLHLRELYRELFQPIEDILRGRNLIIVPHSFLHYLPFHALHDGESFLADRFLITYAPSASVYYLCCIKEVENEGGVLVLGVPDDRKPYVLEEAKAVAEAVPDAQLFMGKDASEEALRAVGGKCRALHISTHGFFRRDNPMFSAIQLGTSELNLFDLYSLNLSAEMAAVIGCGRGLEVGEDGDEIVGLTRGLLYAGARTVLVTLWNVEDDSSLLFMRTFYRDLAGGMRKEKALYQAMLSVRERYPHPFYWAPYILVGARGSS